MKKFTILTIAPALTLLAISCSGPAAMQSTEYDDMYYSTADNTEYVQPATKQPYALAEEAEQQDEAASSESGAILNPEYADNTEDITRNYNGNDEYEYYDGREYEPRDNWYRPNYSFVDPSWAYDPYPSYRSYSYHDRYYRHRYGDPFYDPFYYDPFAYRPYYGSGLIISIGFNYGWGGYYGRYSPYCYSPYYNNYYGGYYGGYYGHNYVYDYPRYIKPYKVQYGPRGERGGVVTDGVQRDGRSERGTLTESTEQRATQGRPSRTERGRSTERIGSPTTEESKEVITTRPGRESYRPRSSEARPGRDRVEDTQQQQREQPATRPATEQPRPNREYRPQRENRQEQRSTEKRPRESAPRRESTRAYEQRETRTTEQRETRHSEPAPSRSSSSESRSSGRPPRGN